jgi:predicted GNAT superfamily acetyltransferase
LNGARVLTLAFVKTCARLLTAWDDLVAASDVVTQVWGDSAALAAPSLLRTYTHYGNPVIGAFAGDRLSGVSIGFLGTDPEVHLHSHITCVIPSQQHLGIGYDLKLAQRDWCAEKGIGLVTWTFDPMLARNAYFNLHKLGATARRVLPDFYGEMDDDINRGEKTDRLEAWWRVDGESAAGEVERTVAVPDDYFALRAADGTGATRRRAEVVAELTAAFDDGLIASDFDREKGYCFTRP